MFFFCSILQHFLNHWLFKIIFNLLCCEKKENEIFFIFNKVAYIFCLEMLNILILFLFMLHVGKYPSHFYVYITFVWQKDLNKSEYCILYFRYIKFW